MEVERTPSDSEFGVCESIEVVMGGPLVARCTLDRVIAEGRPAAVLLAGDDGRSEVARVAAEAGFVVLSAEFLREANVLAGITDRQGEILSLLGAGCRQKQIQRELGISLATMKRELSALRRRFGVSTTKELRVTVAGTAGTSADTWVAHELSQSVP
jgi:DNA-binding CsgD family transcriptional regulator